MSEDAIKGFIVSAKNILGDKYRIPSNKKNLDEMFKKIFVELQNDIIISDKILKLLSKSNLYKHIFNQINDYLSLPYSKYSKYKRYVIVGLILSKFKIIKKRNEYELSKKTCNNYKDFLFQNINNKLKYKGN